MTLDQIINNEILNYKQSKIDELVNSGRCTYEEISKVIKVNCESNYTTQIMALKKGKTMPEYVALVLSIESKILAKIQLVESPAITMADLLSHQD